MQETYKEFIQNILDTRGRFACGDEYHERHHIVPKSCGGGNEQENLIDLYAREHFIAHKLLALENPENNSLVFAWSCMAFIKREDMSRYELTPEEYEEARIALSKVMSGRVVSEETKRKIGEASSNRSEETIRKLSESAKARFADSNNHPWTGRHHTEETKEKISDTLKGKFAEEKHPMYGKTPSDFCKQRTREANSGYKNWHSRTIYSIELDRLFWGATEISDEFSFDLSSISKCCKGKNKSCGKHSETGEKLHWLYAEDAIEQGYITQQDLDDYLNSLKEEGE